MSLLSEVGEVVGREFLGLVSLLDLACPVHVRMLIRKDVQYIHKQWGNQTIHVSHADCDIHDVVRQ